MSVRESQKGEGKKMVLKTPRLISIVFPVYNEAESLPPFLVRMHEALRTLGTPYELIAVDDGSTDGSLSVLRERARTYPHLRVLGLRVNAGQTAALSAGIEEAKGDVIVTIDSDLENDPHDIPKLLEKIHEGFHIVSGWRQNRWEGATLSRRLPSRIANALIARATGVPLHDFGCTLKAYRADVIKGVRLYGDMHRFVAAYAVWQGGKVAEVPVSHTPRQFGKSKYGIGRTFRVLLDLILVVFMRKYMSRPMHFFGGWGVVSLLLGGVAGSGAILLRVLGLRHFVDTPLPILSTLFILVGVQLLLFGVIAELMMRTYFESQNKRPYLLVAAEEV